MKKFSLPIIASTSALIATLFVASCDQHNYKPTKDEAALIRRIKAEVSNVNDAVSVAKIQDGAWSKVCINPLGANTNIEVDFIDGKGLRKKNLKINTPTDTFADDYKWGIYFIRGDDSVDYYNIPAIEIDGNAPDGCVDKESAKFVVIGTFESEHAGKPSASKVSKDFIYIKLTE